MAPSLQLPNDFQVSYRDRDSYPRNYTHRSVSTYPSALAEFAKRLDIAADDLCEKDVSNVEVSFRDLKSDNGAGKVSPDYLDFLFIFGLQADKQELRFSSFREQTSMRQECVTLKNRNPDDPSKDEYSIRPAAFYHRLDIENGNTLWMVTKGGLDIQGRFKELTGKNARPQDKSFGSPEECFSSSLSAHLLFCHWSTEDWRAYIKWLETIVDKETKMAVLGPTGSGHHHRIYTAGDIQKLLTWEEKISEVITVLESNVEVMNSLKQFYEKLSVNKDFDLKECSYDIEVFVGQLSHMMDDFRLQIGRAKALVRVMSNRTELVKQHRLERLNGNLEKEAIVVRIVTIVTLIYLPATFVSTLFSTDIIKYQGSPHGNYSPVAMQRWLQVTLPLTFLTLCAAYMGKRWAEQKSHPTGLRDIGDESGDLEAQDKGNDSQQNGDQQATPLNQWWQWAQAGGGKAEPGSPNKARALINWRPKSLAARVSGPPVPLLPMNHRPKSQGT
ncbi:hypothetical protein G7Z17_g5039 [Cylindrodendrum hubeiense]|uniref:CorA-like transporter domain-containing protein n=1 Tax=Cylindrodendrum hubeiense TaxID=595255 RepID=A0A9P5HDN9_9HYPO|nr:hypothetical protein G7Z17_g5039 [Cylindrodendrum hubeiense]